MESIASLDWFQAQPIWEMSVYGGQVVSGFRCAEVTEGDFCPPTVTKVALQPVPDPLFDAEKR